ncbi:AMP-binding protein [Streptomyces sp. NPDC004232]|uniref:AMP-binding protein n=1 Tax=Streptomyces sp. NPDC004232 TaxID=3154454 RepID=UPI0033B0DB69
MSDTRVSLIDGLLARADSDDIMVEVLSPAGGPTLTWTYRQVIGAARVLADDLAVLAARLGRTPRVGLLAENSAEWVVADLALLFSGAVEIPVPTAFSAEQAASLLAGADACLVDSRGADKLAQWGSERVLAAGCQVDSVDLPALIAAGAYRDWGSPRASEAERGGGSPPIASWDEDAVFKVIHTSGTTSAPKGVMIRRHGIEALLDSLRRRSTPEIFRRYLSIVPLSLLVEQVTGLYMPFLAGGSVIFLPPGTALVGTSGDAAPRMLSLLRSARPTAVVLPPTMAALLLSLCVESPDETVEGRYSRFFGHDGPVFIACGGAPVPPEVLTRLKEFGLPLYEGYGLSENSSVVAWNFPGNVRIGTVGKPLDHVEVKLADDGELYVRSSSLFAGYTVEDPSSCAVDEDGWLHTGDLATIDDDGYIRIVGRKKNIIITAGGRNVSPEFVEARYRQLPFVREAVVLADGLDTVRGLFVVDAARDEEVLRKEITDFGREHLSDVERVTDIRLMRQDDSGYLTCFTVTGRPKRQAVRDLLLTQAPIEEHA